jgi:hypothetical protein
MFALSLASASNVQPFFAPRFRTTLVPKFVVGKGEEKQHPEGRQFNQKSGSRKTWVTGN